MCVCIFIDLTKSTCNNVRVYDCLCIHPSTTFNTPMQILSNSINSPSSLKGKKFPLRSSHLKQIAHPKAADAAASFSDPGGEFSKKKKLRPQFSSLRPHQDQGLVPQSPGHQLVVESWRKMRLFFICKKTESS